MIPPPGTGRPSAERHKQEMLALANAPAVYRHHFTCRDHDGDGGAVFTFSALALSQAGALAVLHAERPRARVMHYDGATTHPTLALGLRLLRYPELREWARSGVAREALARMGVR